MWAQVGVSTCRLWKKLSLATAFAEILNIRQPFKIIILSPHDSAHTQCRRIHDTVRQRQLVIDPHLRRHERQRRVEIDDRALLHQRESLQCVALATLPQDNLEHLEQADSRYDEPTNRLDRACEVRRSSFAGEIFQPRGRIDYILSPVRTWRAHTRSRSRRTVVSIPLRKPRMLLSVRTGMNSIRLS